MLQDQSRPHHTQIRARINGRTRIARPPVRLYGGGAVTLATGNYVNVKKSNGLDAL